MPLSWNEIRHRAIAFSKDWTGVKREQAEKQTFWNEFFSVFGIPRRAVATFEEPVRKLSGKYGFIDLFWPGKVLVEHKSRGEDLSKAELQAFSYIQALLNEGRTDEIPRYVIVSDFGRIALHDLEPDDQQHLPLFHNWRVATLEFPLAEFHNNIHAFAFIPGYKQHKIEAQDPINIQAVEIMGRLHDALELGGYSGHRLERFLVRILFCLFSQNTGIFEPESFRLYLLNRTAQDGSDLGLHLVRLFDVLNTPNEERQKNLDEDLAAFRYVNGDLFAENLRFADFDSDMRNALLACTLFDWSRISPAIFGSLFQSVMEPKERRQIGGHYTNERDILKLIRSLFLDDLRAEFERAKASQAELKRFHQKLAGLHFLDPACGCGNFLVITYRELRLLELEILKLLYLHSRQGAGMLPLSLIDVDAFYGVEISEWPARIAELAMWLMDHQMNLRLSEAFGEYFTRLPLKKSPTIVCGNALRLDWKQILPPEQCNYVLGNPPFVGGKFQTNEQRADMDLVARDVENSGLLDYVAAWYFKAAEYIKGTHVIVAFVSTNSISQGEQVGVLWNPLFKCYGLKIVFAHRTFTWQSEARGKAHVHVVIVGFAASNGRNKRIYEYEDESEKASVSIASNISPYLVEGPDRAIVNRSSPLCDAPDIGIGNKPIDDGNYLFTPKEKAEFLRLEPDARDFFRRWIGSEEFINGIERWCLWLGDCPPTKLRKMPKAMARVEAVRKFRLASKSAPTRAIANRPTRFHVENMPTRSYLVIPEVSSERRNYIPIGFLKPEILASSLVRIVPNSTLYHFGILSSGMHMAWLRQVGGRLKSDYRYSAKLVYNNYPWPEAPTARHKAAVEDAAQAVLDARKEFPNATLADLYDPLAMPPALAKAHADLDRAVDRCYRSQPFENDRKRVEYLFALYEKLTSPLIPTTRKGRKKP